MNSNDNNDKQKHQVSVKERENQSQIGNSLIEFAGNTSAHGIGKLISHLWYVRALWLLLIIGATGCLAYHMSTMIGKFLLEPVSTSVTLRGVDSVYPGVTVCNKKFLSVSAMARKVPTNDSQQVWQWNPNAIRFFNNLRNLTNLTEHIGLAYFKRISTNSSLTPSAFLMQYEDNKYNLGPLIFRDTNGIVSFSEHSLHPEKLLIRCRFGRHACDISDFSVQQMHDNPFCITFNVTSVQTKNRLSTSDINSYELELYYYTDSSQFNAKNLIPGMKIASDPFFHMNSNGGADLYIHQPGAYPGTGNKIEVPNGYKATVSVTYQEFQFVNTAKRQCLDSYPTDYMNYWQRTHSGAEGNLAYSYTNTDCFFKQLQTLIYKHCGCLSYDYPVPSSLKTDGVALCLNITQAYISVNKNSTQTLNVSSEVSFLFQMITAAGRGSISSDIRKVFFSIIRQFKCERRTISIHQVQAAALCTGRCRSSQYSMQTSLYTWPSQNADFLSEDLLKWLESNVYYMRDNETVLNQTFVREVNRGIYDILTQVKSRGASIAASNFLSIKLDVADKSGKSTITEESLSYQVSDLLCDIGGILGLYIGVSVLTLCEVLELMLGLINFVVSGARSRRRVTQHQQQQQQQQQQQKQQSGTILVVQQREETNY